MTPRRTESAPPPAAEAPRAPQVCSPASFAAGGETPAFPFATASHRPRSPPSGRNSTATTSASKQGRSFLFRNQLARNHPGKRQAHAYGLLFRIGGGDPHFARSQQ